VRGACRPRARVECRDMTFALQQQGDSRWSNYLVESFGHVLLLGGRPSFDCHRPCTGRGAVRAPNIGSMLVDLIIRDCQIG
jgi:hypothetical protein